MDIKLQAGKFLGELCKYVNQISNHTKKQKEHPLIVPMFLTSVGKKGDFHNCYNECI